MLLMDVLQSLQKMPVSYEVLISHPKNRLTSTLTCTLTFYVGFPKDLLNSNVMTLMICKADILYTLYSLPVRPALPASYAVLQSPLSVFYAGDTVSLQCNIAENTDWGCYYWYRDYKLIPSMTSKAITVNLPDQPGQYQFMCEGQRNIRPKKSQISTAITIKTEGKYIRVMNRSGKI